MRDGLVLRATRAETNAGTYTVTLNINASVASLVIGGAFSGVQTAQDSGGFTLSAASGSVNSGGVFSLVGSTLTGALAVGSGGLLSANRSTLNAQVTVESGGEFQAFGSSYIGQGGAANNPNNWLWVQSGGLVDISSGGIEHRDQVRGLQYLG